MTKGFTEKCSQFCRYPIRIPKTSKSIIFTTTIASVVSMCQNARPVNKREKGDILLLRAGRLAMTSAPLVSAEGRWQWLGPGVLASAGVQNELRHY